MRTLLKFTLITLVALVISLQETYSQAIIIDFVNKKLSADGMSWSFDMVAKGDPTTNYGGAENGQWISMNVNVDLSLPPGVSIVGGTATPDPTYASSSASVYILVPGPPGIPGQVELGLTSERSESDPDLNTTSFVKLGSYTVNFSAPVAQGNPAFPRFETTDFGSTWTNFANDQILRPITFVNVQFPLPVKLISFDASSEGIQANLTWKTSEESNSSHFDVQRSKDGKHWATITTVKAMGEGKIERTYNAADLNPLSGENLYRLQMVDHDGSSAYSMIRNLKFESVTKGLYPNPVSTELTIDAADFSKVSNVSIVNAAGLEVFRSTAKPTEKVDVSKFNAGMYVVKVKTTNGEESNYKVLVVK